MTCQGVLAYRSRARAVGYPGYLSRSLFATHFSVAAALQVHFSARFPLVMPKDHAIGTLCVVNRAAAAERKLDPGLACACHGGGNSAGATSRKSSVEIRTLTARAQSKGAGEGMCGLDAEGRVQFINAATTRMLVGRRFSYSADRCTTSFTPPAGGRYVSSRAALLGASRVLAQGRYRSPWLH